MNKLMTSLTLLAGLGLTTLAPLAEAGDRHHGRGIDYYAQNNDRDEQRAYRKGYRDARREVRQHRHARHQQRHGQRYCQYPRHGKHYNGYRRSGYSTHDTHGHNDWRVVFKF